MSWRPPCASIKLRSKSLPWFTWRRLFQLSWMGTDLGVTLTDTDHLSLPPMPKRHHPFSSTFSVCTHSTWKHTGYHFLKVVCNRWLLAYRITIVGTCDLQQISHLWCNFHLLHVNPAAPGTVTLVISSSGGSFSKQVLLTCSSFDLLVAFAVNFKVFSNAAALLCFSRLPLVFVLRFFEAIYVKISVIAASFKLESYSTLAH